MFVVRTLNDLSELHDSARISPHLLQAIEIKFHELMDVFIDPDQQPESFTLQDSGNIYILAPGDDPEDLSDAGLPKGLYKSSPEYATFESLVDGSHVIVCWIMYNNEWMASFWIPEAIYSTNHRLSAFLKDYLEEDQQTLIQAFL